MPIANRNTHTSHPFPVGTSEKGNANALTTLAHRQIADGKNTEALANLKWAARTSSVAAYNLGQMYFFGTTVEVDREIAMKYLRQAAEGNNPDAQYFLAALTWDNEKGAPAIGEAISWAQKSENLGNAKAPSLRENLEKRRRDGSARPEESTGTRSS